MKKLLAVTILFAAFLTVSRASAENNPLFTVFEGIKVGADGTSHNSIITVLLVYTDDSSTGWGALNNPFIKYSQRTDINTGNVIERWQWKDKIFAKHSLIEKSPESTLELIVNKKGHIISAKYTYLFLDMTKILEKTDFEK